MPDTKRVLVLQHIVENPAGRVGFILDEYEIPYHLLHVGKDHLPDPTRYQAIVVLGGTQHVYDRHRYPYTVHEETYLHQAIKQGIPYLGMCLGGQLLAYAFQATVKKLPKVHIGFLQVQFTEAGLNDPLYKGLPGYQQAFQWHEDAFLLPAGALSHWLTTLVAQIKPFAMYSTLMGCSTMSNSPRICSTPGYMTLP